jgi:SAM-dependent methyltransferase
MESGIIEPGQDGKHGSLTKLPGHWVLASLGKRVLRPGGMELTRWMLSRLALTDSDEIVELAPGIGATAREILTHKPKMYTAVDLDPGVIERLTKSLAAPNRSFVRASAQDTKLPDASATVAVGEAFLTMQTPRIKQAILAEVARLLRPGGRYGLHELGVVSSGPEKIETIRRELSQVIRVNASPLTLPEWKDLLHTHGLEITAERVRPMELLRMRRLFEDEGLWGGTKVVFNAIRNPEAAKRVLEMRRVFEKYADCLVAFSLVARKTVG